MTDVAGHTITEYEQVQAHFQDYYITLLGTKTPSEVDVDPFVIEEGLVLNIDQQLALLTKVIDDMVKQALWSIPKDKSPGPDGFESGFFKAAWSVVGRDVFRAVHNFFCRGNLLKELNATHLVLHIKTNHLVTTEDYRPIACCGVVYKIIAKILSDKLQQVLPELINCNKSAFV